MKSINMDFIFTPEQWWAFSPWAFCLASPHQSRSRSQMVVEWVPPLSDTKWDLRGKNNFNWIYNISNQHSNLIWSQALLVPPVKFTWMSLEAFYIFRKKWSWAILCFLFLTSPKIGHFCSRGWWTGSLCILSILCCYGEWMWMCPQCYICQLV